MLRDELVDKMNKQEHLTQFSYTTSLAIWSIALTIKNEWIVLLVLLIVVPISLRIVKFRKDSAFIGAYMAVFLEKDLPIKWEINNSEYYNKHPRRKLQTIFYWFSKFDFVFIVVISIMLFWLMKINNLIIINNLITVLMIIFQLAVLTIEFFVVKYFSNFSKQKGDFIEEWKNLYFEKQKLLEKTGVNNEK